MTLHVFAGLVQASTKGYPPKYLKALGKQISLAVSKYYRKFPSFIINIYALREVISKQQNPEIPHGTARITEWIKKWPWRFPVKYKVFPKKLSQFQRYSAFKWVHLLKHPVSYQINNYGNTIYTKNITSSITKSLDWGMFVMFQYKKLLIKKKTVRNMFNFTFNTSLKKERFRQIILLARSGSWPAFSPLFVLRLNTRASLLPQELELPVKTSKLKIPLLIQRQTERMHLI